MGMDICCEQALALLDEKCRLLREIETMTMEAELFGDDDDAQKYIALVDRRDPVIERMKGIDSQLASGALNEAFHSTQAVFQTEVEQRKKELEKLAKNVVQLDSEMSKGVANAMAKVKTEIKSAVQGKNIQQRYQVGSFYGVSHFDTKK